MGVQNLSSRAVIGMYYQAMEGTSAAPWVDAVSNYFTSDQPVESYQWIGMAPVMQEWIGGRQAKGFIGNGIEIANRHYEATLEILIRDLRRDKTGQLQARISEFAARSQQHFASLLSTLIVNGESTVCYDGQYFFDTDHSEGSSGTQSNDIEVDISALPAQVHGTPTVPSPEEFQQAMQAAITQVHTLVDDRGEPMNEDANAFLVMVPSGLATYARAALSMMRSVGPGTVDMDGYSLSLAINPRLTSVGSWTDKFVVFRTDGSVKSLIRQEETTPQMKMKDENSEFAFDNDAIQLGIDSWRNVGYGFWQQAVLTKMV